MTIGQALFSIEGRMTRSEYWLKGFLPVLVPIGVLNAVLLYGLDTSLSHAVAGFVGGIAQWMGIALLVKRLHDRNRSGWFALIFLIPLLGAIWLFVEVICLAGTLGPNRFGPDCRQPVTGVADGAPVEQPSLPVKARVLASGVIALLVLTYMLVVLGVPVIGNILNDYGARLPAPTQLVFDLFRYCKTLDWFGPSLLAGFLVWYSLRLSGTRTAGAPQDKSVSRLWLILACVGVFSVIFILAMAMPFFRMGEVIR